MSKKNFTNRFEIFLNFSKLLSFTEIFEKITEIYPSRFAIYSQNRCFANKLKQLNMRFIPYTLLFFNKNLSPPFLIFILKSTLIS